MIHWRRAVDESNISLCRVPKGMSRSGTQTVAMRILICQAILSAALLAGHESQAQSIPRYRYHQLPAGYYATDINRIGELVANIFEADLSTVFDRRLENPALNGRDGAINASGDVAYSSSDDFLGSFGAIRHADGEWFILGEPYIWSRFLAGAIPKAINDSGQVVGNVNYGEGQFAGVVWGQTGIVLADCVRPLYSWDFEVDPCHDAWVSDISDGGIIVGSSTADETGLLMGTYWTHPDLPRAIDAGGAVAIGGERWIAVGTSGGAGVFDLDTEELVVLGAGIPEDINADGWMVGKADGEAVLWMVDDPGTTHRLADLLEWSEPQPPVLESVRRISDCGVITGETGGVGWFLTRSDSLDTDGDGLFDRWEECGVHVGNDALVDLILKDADPERKDIYVELDAMSGRVPSLAVLQDVVDAFANAPVDNPAGPQGIRLHFVGASIPYDPESGCDPCVDDTDLPDAPWGPSGTVAFATARDDRSGSSHERIHPNWENIELAKNGTHRYGICAHSADYVDESGSLVPDTAGQSEALGNEFVVTLGLWTDLTQQDWTSTLMHELGHTLGLEHGGFAEDAGPEMDYKPNYKSVMNNLWSSPPWRWSLEGVPDIAMDLFVNSWRLDFSRGDLNVLDENNLADDAQGIGGNPTFYVPIGVPTSSPLLAPTTALVPMGGAIDWSPGTNGGLVASNVNCIAVGGGDFAGATDDLGILRDHNDWAALSYLPNHTDEWWNPIPLSGPAAQANRIARNRSTLARCLTFTEARALSSLRLDCNANGIPDQQEIASAQASDHNSNGIPDACEPHASGVRESTPPDEGSGIAITGVGPNPFNPRTEISFVGVHDIQTTVNVFNTRGQSVATLFAGPATGQVQTVAWSAEGIPSGVYFVRVDAAGRSETAKLVLLR